MPSLPAIHTPDDRFRRVFEGGPVGSALVRLAAPFVVSEANAALLELLGLPAPSVLGRGLPHFVHPDDRSEAMAVVGAVARGERRQASAEVRLIGADRPRWALLTAAVLDVDDAPGYAVVQFVDIGAHKETEAEFERRSLHDPLTGLPNRRLFLDRLGQSLARAERRPHTLGLLYVDLDHFKEINDTLGHDAGDRLLVAVAERLTGAVRPADTVARLGGDEFVVLVEDAGSQADLAGLVARLHRALSEPLVLSNRRIVPKASIGRALADETLDPVLLLRRADAAMYDAKLAARDGSAARDGARRAVARRLEVDVVVRRAVTGRGLRLSYQPVIDLRHGGVVAVEALARLDGPDGEILPGEFLGPAADAGLLPALEQRVLAAAAEQHRNWTARFGPAAPGRISVNLSSVDALDLDRTGWFDDGASGVVAVEVTPAVAGRAGPEVFERFAARGIGVTIDGLADDYPLLPALAGRPVDTVKLAASLVGGLGRGNDELVATIVRLARALGLRTVATGVETEEQAATLRKFGCELAQGYFFGAASPAALVESGWVRPASRPARSVSFLPPATSRPERS